MEKRELIIKNYINAYNSFDIEKMVADIDISIRFINISNSAVNMEIEGLSNFLEQAQQAKKMFTQRQQTILSFKHQKDFTEIDIDYKGVLAIDLPNGLQKGSVLTLKGRSIFKFADNKVIELTDIS